jgi:D-aspartate ligase
MTTGAEPSLASGAGSTVAVFDIDLPTGLAFVRSLARAGIPFQAYSNAKWTLGRASRYVGKVEPCPSAERVDTFVEWVAEAHAAGAFGLVAPTSDYVSFACAEAAERTSGFVGVGTPPDAIRRCLFKHEFAAAMTAAGFPVPASTTPSTVEEAMADAEVLGYPVLLKPRSHAGVGIARGRVATTPAALRQLFVPYEMGKGRSLALARDEHLGLPLLQRYHAPDSIDVISISGCLDAGGRPLSVSACRKLGQWPRRLGAGTMFEPIEPPPFTEAGLAATAVLLERGIFELEVMVDRTTNEYWAIDLNPRAFGQISLDIALGKDLPVIWYDSTTGATSRAAPARKRRPRYWLHAVPTHANTAAGLVRGPDRLSRARESATRAAEPHVGVVFDRRDPAPGLLFAFQVLRHPRRLIRTILKDTEAV